MKNANKIKRQKKERRRIRIKAKIKGTASRPRLSVFRSNKYIFLQLIDDEKGKTLFSASDLAVKKAGTKGKNKAKTTKKDSAFDTGKKLAELAKKKKIQNIVFDRSGCAYNGRVKAVAEGAREGGLKF